MKIGKRFDQFLWIAMMLLLTAVLVWAQTSGTSLRGTVTDPSGAVIAGAQVTLDDPASGFHASNKTDAKGLYSFPQLPPGTTDWTTTTRLRVTP